MPTARRSAPLLGALLLARLLAGCSDSDSSDSDAPAATTITPASNLPGVTFTQQIKGAQGLRLLSSNLVQKQILDQTQQRWVGEIINDSDKILCGSLGTLTFRDSAGSSLLEIEVFTSGDPHRLPGSGLGLPCTPPQKSGVLSGDHLGASIPLETIRSATLSLTSLADSNLQAWPALQVSNSEAAEDSQVGASSWLVRGTLQASEPVTAIHVAAYPRTADGLLMWGLNAWNSKTIAAGASWDFTTTGQDTQINEYLIFVSFNQDTKAGASSP